MLDLGVLVIAFCWWVFTVDWFGWYMIWLVGCFGGCVCFVFVLVVVGFRLLYLLWYW